MKIASVKPETEKTVKYHYFLFENKFKKVMKKLEEGMHYHHFIKTGKFDGLETVYDVPNNLLSNAGLVLSKQREDDKIFFKVRKISVLPGGYRRPSQKFFLAECDGSETPKDFPTQIANAISNSFSNVFTIDLVSVVRQTVPKYEIRVYGKKYRIVSGNGYEAKMLYETAVYRDLEQNKKVKKMGITLILPKSEKCEQNNKTIIESFEHFAPELIPYKESRYEIAQRLLHPEPLKPEVKDEEEEEK